MPPKRVVISGYYGLGSVGDEAILLSMASALRKEMANVELTVLSGKPHQTELDHGISAISRTDIFKIIGLLRRSDLFISGGGGLMQNISSLKSVVYYGALIVLAKLMGARVMVYAQGLGPLKGGAARLLTRFTFSFADLITVRDSGSKDLLFNIGLKERVTTLADPVFDLDASFITIKDSPTAAREGLKAPLIGLALRKWAGVKIEKFARLADGLVDNLGASLLFIPMMYPNDLMVSQEIAARMKSEAAIFDSPSPLATMAAIGRLDLLIGIPLHSLIMAAKEGVPFMAISYDPKVDSFLGLVGRKSASSLQNFEVDKLISLAKLHLETPGLGLAMEDKLLELKVKAKQNASLARKLLLTRQVLGLKLDALSLEEAIIELEGLIEEGQSHQVVTLNTEIAALAQSDKGLLKIINEASLVLADSVGIKWAANLKEKAPGIELAKLLCALAAAKGYSVVFFGSAPGVAELAAANLTKEHPNLKVAACYSGYYSAAQEEEMLADLKRLKPDIILVGLGAPRQEKWLADNLKTLGIPLGIGVGGSFDVLSGRSKRAPLFVRKLNLEWLYRLLTQPKKRFKRVLTALPKFVYLVIKENMRTGAKG